MTSPSTNVESAMIEYLQLDQVFPNPNNRRIANDDPETAELAESMRTVGQLQPIMVRRVDGLPDVILFGERRWRAAKLAGLETIEAKVITCDDRTALEITVIENLQRKNPHPLEEARGIRILIDGGWALDEIAKHLGKSPSWVAGRAQLTDLSEIWSNGPKELTWATVGHLELIARLPVETQDDLAKDAAKRNWWQPSIKDLKKDIQQKYMNLLRSAPWKLDDAGLVPAAGSCEGCTKRSCRQKLLFGEHTDKTDRCLDASCWAGKTSATTKRSVEKLSAKHDHVAVLVNTSYGQKNTPAPAGLPDQAVVVHQHYTIERVKKSTPGAIPAIEAESGRQVWIKPNDRADVAVRQALGMKGGRKEVAGKKNTSDNNAKVNEYRRMAKRFKYRFAQIESALENTATPDTSTLLRLMVVLLVDHGRPRLDETWEAIVKVKCEQMDKDRMAIWDHIQEHLRLYALGHVLSSNLPEPGAVEAMERLVKLDPESQITKALIEIPEPKVRKAKAGKAKS